MEYRKLRAALCASFTLAVLLAVTARGEHLPIKTYTTADGLVRDSINRIVRDSRGFLWFCTTEGLSRFDGYRFTSYGTEDGLPNRNVKDLLETRAGVYWIAMAGGVCRFNPTTYSTTEAFPRAGLSPASEPRFTAYRPSRDARSQSVNAMIEDRAGNIWCGTESGLYRLEQVEGRWEFQFVDIGLPTKTWDDTSIRALMEDRRGHLWIGAGSGLYRRFTDGRIERYTRQDTPYNDVRALTEDKEGRLWAGTTSGLWQIQLESNQTVIARVYTVKDGLLNNRITSLCQSSDGDLWIGNVGVSIFDSTTGKLRSYTTEHGLSANIVSALEEDSDGNLWIGSESGAMKMARNGLTTYGVPDGLNTPRVSAIFEGQSGELYTITGRDQPRLMSVINRFDGRRFIATAPNLPRDVTPSWGWNQITFQDSTGQWWIPTAKGLFRYPKVKEVEQLARARPKAVYTRKDGLADDEIFRLFEDSRGDIWISLLNNFECVMMRWERATETFHRYSKSDNIPLAAPTAFREDGGGNLWIGYYTGGLMRYRARRFDMMAAAEGLSEDLVRALYLDRSGRLWAATGQRGLIRIDDPQAESPSLVAYTMAEGLSSNQITCITEDEWGRIYIGTGRGLDRLDPATGRIRHYTAADGLGHGLVNVAFRDRRGALWFGTSHGLSRLIPEPDRPATSPPVLISGLRIAGMTYPVSDLGEINMPLVELSADQNQIEIDFFGVSFSLGDALRYQYKLEGADREWKPLTNQRTVNYASLSPGAYRFLVQAVSADGTASLAPASVDFRILPPLWQRWWFLTLAGILIAASVFAFDRYRAARVKAIKESENRFRTLAETASDAIITVDNCGTIIFVNQAAETVFGYEVSEMLGQDLTMLMPEYLRHLHRNGFSRYLETGRRHLSWEAIELPGLHKSGREVPLEISFGEFTRDDRHFFTGVARDITERKRAEEALARSREERLIEIEQVRRRIATDLHDDIGSSLTQISILSEVAQRDTGDDSSVTRPLAMIASASRELIDSMSDIVWAINPQKDHLSDLTQRMRLFASNIFTARSIKFRFIAPAADEDVRIGAHVRREVFLIFKESVNNLTRHSHCTEANIEFRLEDNSLALTVTDNGAGFDLTAQSNGHGLVSMQERAEAIGARFEVVSNGEGTVINLKLPLNPAASRAG